MNPKNEKQQDRTDGTVGQERSTGSRNRGGAASTESSQGTARSGTYTGSAGGGYGEAGTTGDRWGTQASGSNMGNEGIGEMFQRFTQSLELRERMDRHPYATLAAAAAVGYLLGGGRLIPLVFGVGMRAASVPFVRDRLTRVVSEVFSAARQQRSAERSYGTGS